MGMQWQKYKSLNFLCQTARESRTCIVLFHGYGADADDLASLSRVFKLSEDVDWFFPQGVHSVPIGPMMSGRAWFHLRASDFDKIGTDSLGESPIDEEVQKTLQLVVDWLNHIGKLYDRVFIGGFSQGAILTSHCFYRLNYQPTGLLLLSGFLMAPQALPKADFPGDIPFLQTHGVIDQVLPISGARKLFDRLNGGGLKGRWYEFSGGHEIPMDVIAESQTFLDSLLVP